MLTLADIRAGLGGAIGLLRGDAGAMARFDVSYDGFWKSFLAVLVIVPLFLFYVHGEWRLLAQESDMESVWESRSYGGFIAMRLVVMAVDWLAYPLIILAVARPLGIAGAVVPYIVAQNWAAALASALIALPSIAFGFGILPGGIASILTLLLFAVVLRFFYFVARTALQVPAGFAVGLVAFNAVLSLVIGELAVRLT